MKNPPDPNAEYVLVFDYPIYAETPEDVILPKDTVVIKVGFSRNDSYFSQALAGGIEIEFFVKATGERHTTNYGYMFALNTPDNLKRLDVYRYWKKEHEATRRWMDLAIQDVDTVKGGSLD